jgi:hypothetical protein
MTGAAVPTPTTNDISGMANSASPNPKTERMSVAPNSTSATNTNLMLRGGEEAEDSCGWHRKQAARLEGPFCRVRVSSTHTARRERAHVLAPFVLHERSLTTGRHGPNGDDHAERTPRPADGQQNLGLTGRSWSRAGAAPGDLREEVGSYVGGDSGPT